MVSDELDVRVLRASLAGDELASELAAHGLVPSITSTNPFAQSAGGASGCVAPDEPRVGGGRDGDRLYREDLRRHFGRARRRARREERQTEETKASCTDIVPRTLRRDQPIDSSPRFRPALRFEAWMGSAGPSLSPRPP